MVLVGRAHQKLSSIRRGLQQVIAEIKTDKFGNAYRGSSLETVLDSIVEQRQVLKGADHAFMRKPKLRIPDIYENRQNQVAFGNFLDTCLCCDAEEQVIDAIQALDRASIKGLGAAAANLLYFLHPTIAPPFNTAIVRGYNALMGAKAQLSEFKFVRRELQIFCARQCAQPSSLSCRVARRNQVDRSWPTTSRRSKTGFRG